MPLTKFRNTPGVYVEEIPTFPPSVAPVATAIPAFLGYTQNTQRGSESLIGVPIRITSMLEYDNYFVSETNGTKNYRKETGIKVTISGNEDKYTIEAGFGDGAPSPLIFRYAMQMFFANGGSDCYVLSMGTGSGADGSITYAEAMTALGLEDEPTIIVSPEAVLENSKNQSFITEALAQCERLQDRVAIFDVPLPEENGDTQIETFRGWVPASIEQKKYGAAYYPYIETTLNYLYDDAGVTVIDNRTALDDPSEAAPDSTESSETSVTLDSIKNSKNDLYNAIRAKLNELHVTLPSSSAMAGIYARVDNSRGVWKAPANVSVAYCVKPTIKIDDRGQEPLNVDTTTGKSINVIRAFTGRGTMVWGARTLAGNDNEWRYIPVRRFFNFVEESVKKASLRFVFEPNNKNTWVKVKAMIENFLIVQWRAGALVGAKPEDAFFVKVGLNDTMTAEDILNGYMVIEIGMAAVRPAEFIILQFSHKMQES